MAGGRPKKTLAKEFKDWPTWKDDIIGEYAQGASDVEIRALIYEKTGAFSQGRWDRWMDDEPEFLITIKKGRELSEAWWVRNGRKNLQNGKFQYAGWYMNMKNRFGWSDKREVKQEQNVNVKTWLDMFKRKNDEEE